MLCFHRLNNRVSEVRGAGGGADMPGKFGAGAVDLVNGVGDLQGCRVVAEMAQHEQSGAQHGGGIGDILSRYIRCGTVDSFKDGALVAEIRAGDEAEAADQSRAQIGNNVAIKVFHQQDVVLVGIHDQLHAGVVDDVLAVGDLGILFRDVARTTQK